MQTFPVIIKGINRICGTSYNPPTSGILAFQSIAQKIDERKIIIANVGNHAVVVDGYDTLSSSRVWFMDPRHSIYVAEYSSYLSNAGGEQKYRWETCVVI